MLETEVRPSTANYLQQGHDFTQNRVDVTRGTGAKFPGSDLVLSVNRSPLPFLFPGITPSAIWFTLWSWALGQIWVGCLESEAMPRFLYTLQPNPMTIQILNQKRRVRTSKVVLGFPTTATWILSFTYWNFSKNTLEGCPCFVDNLRMSPRGHQNQPLGSKWQRIHIHTPPHLRMTSAHGRASATPVPPQAQIPAGVRCLLSDETFHEEAQ